MSTLCMSCKQRVTSVIILAKSITYKKLLEFSNKLMKIKVKKVKIMCTSSIIF